MLVYCPACKVIMVWKQTIKKCQYADSAASINKEQGSLFFVDDLFLLRYFPIHTIVHNYLTVMFLRLINIVFVISPQTASKLSICTHGQTGLCLHTLPLLFEFFLKNAQISCIILFNQLMQKQINSLFHHCKLKKNNIVDHGSWRQLKLINIVQIHFESKHSKLSPFSHR